MLVTDEDLYPPERPKRIRLLRDALICLCIFGVLGAVLWLIL